MTRGAVMGWDIGGAHVKVAVLDERGTVIAVRQVACPLWEGLERLDEALGTLMVDLAALDPTITHAITMSGELVDLFADRAEGVTAILGAFAKRFPGAPCRIYGGRAGWLGIEDAAYHTQDIASANWHATGNYIATLRSDALLIDIGSTTADLILLRDGEIQSVAFNDGDRMARDELLYSGVVRTPISAITARVPFAGQWQTLAAEYFANMADVYRLTGELGDDVDLFDAADGGAKSEVDSARRLARMLGRDLRGDDLAPWRKVARYLGHCQRVKLRQAAERVLSHGCGLEPDLIIGAGAGEFLSQGLARDLGKRFTGFAALVGDLDDHPLITVAGSAVAVARLASDQAAKWSG